MQQPGQIYPNTAEQRAMIYKLLADCYDIPDEDIYEKTGTLKQITGELYPEVAVPEFEQETEIQELKVDHARLFVGPFTLLAPPYGSMYRDPEGHLMTETTREVQQWYQSEGMDTAIKEVPDHIRIELEFMYYLVYREFQFLDSGSYPDIPNSGQASEYRNKQLNFLKDHLIRWIPMFKNKVKEHARTSLYRELAELTSEFIIRDFREFG